MHFRSNVSGQSPASRFVTLLGASYAICQSHLDVFLANSRMCNQHKKATLRQIKADVDGTQKLCTARRLNNSMPHLRIHTFASDYLF